jgi:hypothetical protein
MGLTLLQLSIRDLEKTSRRIDKVIAEELRLNDFLCRSSDECWSYPDADEKNEMCMDRISESDQRLEKLNRTKECVKMALDALKHLKNKDERKI